MKEKLKFKVITLSDKAYSGEYEDKSGPVVIHCLKEHFKKQKREIEIDQTILPDEPSMLETIIKQSVQNKFDIIISTGATGIGPRDIAPDVVRKIAEKIVPGVTDHVRLKLGKKDPNFLISRSVCAIVGQTIIYTLPGSPKAANEYMGEILKTMEHMTLIITGELD